MYHSYDQDLANNYMYSTKVMAVPVLMNLNVEHWIRLIDDGLKQRNFFEYVDIAFVIINTVVWYAPSWEVLI
jgi:hypothetical protein